MTSHPAVKDDLHHTPPRGSERLLLVDDEEGVTKMGEIMLERLGYHVETMNDPLEALEKVRAFPDRFDLVITDMTMPHLDGVGLARKIREITPGMPVILITGYNSKIEPETAGAMGVQHYVEKPFNRNQLAQAIKTVLSS